VNTKTTLTAIALAAATLITATACGASGFGPGRPGGHGGPLPPPPTGTVRVGGVIGLEQASGRCICAAVVRSGSSAGTRFDPYRSFRFLLNAPTSRGHL
jgi:hypothetical protein